MRACVVALLVSVLSAGPASTQTLPDQGSWSITGSLPDGGGNTFGAWYLWRARTNLGLEVDFRSTRTEDRASSRSLGPDAINTSRRIVIGPTVKHYISVKDPVAAYLRASVGLGFLDEELIRPPAETAERDTRTRTQIYRLALGADWFPVTNVGIGVFTGIVALRDEIEIDLTNTGRVTRGTTNWSTFKSGIELQYYF